MPQRISKQTDRLAHTHHLGTPLAVYRASVIGSNLVYTIIGALLVGGLVVEGLSLLQWYVYCKHSSRHCSNINKEVRLEKGSHATAG
jgi:hypothetical protein